jgi:hypothetical protein
MSSDCGGADPAFLEHYKDLEPDRQVKVIEWVDGTEARQLIADAIAVNKLIAKGVIVDEIGYVGTARRG